MWRLGRQAQTLARRGAVAAAARPAAARQPLADRLRPRAFCADAGLGMGGPTPLKPKKAAQKGGVSAPKVVGAVFVIGGVAYAASETAREHLDALFGSIVETFEEFNETSREFFEGIGDKFVSAREEPWLLDLATMKYPENIPTLVLDVDKVILHLEHDSRQGWHVIKRPYADQFFKEISLYYEVVLFSDEVFPVAVEIATKWNLPVTGVLHREFCKKKRNSYIKDLSKLGRRMDRVLMIDHDPAAFQLQPENGIVIKPFHGDTNDSELMVLLEFLKVAATSHDVRSFLAKHGGGDEDVGRRYLLHKQDQDKLVESRRSVGRVFASSSGFPAKPQQNSFGGGLR